jgi:carbonic anhydrase
LLLFYEQPDREISMSYVDSKGKIDWGEVNKMNEAAKEGKEAAKENKAKK